MIVEIENNNIDNIQFLIRSLIFNAGKGISLNKIRNLFEKDNFSVILDNLRKILEMLGIDLRINDIDDKLFIVPKRDYYTQIEDYTLDKEFLVLSIKQKEIISRFLSIYISEGKNEPISKEKIRSDLRDKFGLDYTERDLKNISELGYINIVRNKFIDLGWRLRGSPEYEDFVNQFINILEGIEKDELNKGNNT